MRRKDDLNLMVFENAYELGSKINDHLKEIRDEDKDYRIRFENSRFSNGEAKIKICQSVREKDLYIVSDIGNYDITYKMHGRDNYMSPDEHFADVKRAINAASNHPRRVSLVMPLLYESRQHKRKGRESLDCAMGLQEIENFNIKNYVTFDAHDPSVSNAVPKMAFDNFFATSSILETLFLTEEDLSADFLIIAPDMGAVERARYYADMIGSDVGCFNKRRDYSRLVNGKNPIVAHDYLGSDMKNKNIIIVDDMIASGGSVIDVAREARKRGAKKVFVCTTFALFTEGIEVFEHAYQNGLIDRLYSTNVSYVPEDIKNKEWYVDVDCSYKLAKIINALNVGDSLEPLHHDSEETYQKLRKIRH